MENQCHPLPISNNMKLLDWQHSYICKREFKKSLFVFKSSIRHRMNDRSMQARAQVGCECCAVFRNISATNQSILRERHHCPPVLIWLIIDFHKEFKTERQSDEYRSLEPPSAVGVQGWNICSSSSHPRATRDTTGPLM